MRGNTVLLVEDNPGDAALMRDLLAELAEPPEVLHAARLSDAVALLATARVDVVLLDLSLPDARGLATVERVHRAAPHLPVVVLTGLDDEALALRAVQAGAQDYLVKGAVTAPGLRRALRHARERQRLVEAERRAVHARDVVLGVVAHDLRNPLAAVRMCAGALAAGGRAAADAPTPEAVSHFADVIRGSVELMERIIRDLLDVSAIEAGKLRVDLDRVAVAAALATAQELAEPLAEAQGVTLVLRADAGAARAAVRADPERLQQAFGNLLGNAVKFTPRGGRVTLSAALGTGVVRFAVADTGPGIPTDHLPHLFDRFWQARETRRGGAGLGLAIVKGIVEAHGGALGVDSVPNEGATFWLEIPED